MQLIKKWRTALKLSVAQAAKKLKMSRQRYEYIENVSNAWPKNMLFKMLEACQNVKNNNFSLISEYINEMEKAKHDKASSHKRPRLPRTIPKRRGSKNSKGSTV